MSRQRWRLPCTLPWDWLSLIGGILTTEHAVIERYARRLFGISKLKLWPLPTWTGALTKQSNAQAAFLDTQTSMISLKGQWDGRESSLWIYTVSPHFQIWISSDFDIHLFSAASVRFIPTNGTTIISSLVQEGVVPSSPLKPHVAITIQGLELFWIAQLCCPLLLVQAWVKSLCDIHGVSLSVSYYLMTLIVPSIAAVLSSTSVSPVLWCIWRIPSSS